MATTKKSLTNKKSAKPATKSSTVKTTGPVSSGKLISALKLESKKPFITK
jgi:hypothetical protein